MAFMTTAGAAPVPDSPTPLAPSSDTLVRRLHVHDVDVGHLGGHRHQVVGHGAVGELAGLVVEAVLVERAAEALHAAAAHLLVGELRVDDATAVLHHPMLEQLARSRCRRRPRHGRRGCRW